MSGLFKRASNGSGSYSGAFYKARQKEELKRLIYIKLGDCCKRCGYNDKRALQIDHVNGKGKQLSKKERRTNAHKYLKMVLADTTGAFQMLCANCNWIKRFENNEN